MEKMMKKTTFMKFEAFTAGCFLASKIDGSYDDDEHGLIFDKIMMSGEGLAKKVDHDEFFEKWETYLNEGGFEKIESEVLKSLKRCGKAYRTKVVAWMEHITYASKSPNEDKWQDSKEKALIDRFVNNLDLNRYEVDKQRNIISI